MTVFEALQSTDKEDVARGITNIIVKNIKQYSDKAITHRALR